MKINNEDNHATAKVVKKRRVALAVASAAISMGLVLASAGPASAAGGFSQTVGTLGCANYTLSGSSYAASGGGAGYTQRSDVICAWTPWANVGMQVYIAYNYYSAYVTGGNYAFSSLSNRSGHIEGDHYYSDGASRIVT